MPQDGFVGAPAGGDPGHAVGIGVGGHQPEGGRREQVTARVPARAHREHVAAGESQPAADELALAGHHVAVVGLERRATAQPVKEIVRLIRRAAVLAEIGGFGRDGQAV